MEESKLDDMNREQLRYYLIRLPINKIPKGNSRFICNKHKQILSYADIVSGCYSCIMDEANTLDTEKVEK